MKLFFAFSAFLVSVAPSTAHASCDDAYKDSLVNSLRDKSQYSSFTHMEEALTRQANESSASKTGFNLSVVIKVPVGFGFSDDGSRSMQELFTQQQSATVSNALLNDITKMTGNKDLADRYNQCKSLEAIGLRLKMTSFDPDAGTISFDLIKSGGGNVHLKSIDYDPSLINCKGVPFPINRRIIITGTPNYTCRRTVRGEKALDITLHTDAGGLSVSLPGNIVPKASLCLNPKALSGVFSSFGETAVFVHKSPKDGANRYYVKQALIKLDDTIKMMKVAGFDSALYANPDIEDIKKSISEIDTGLSEDGFGKRVILADRVLGYSSFVLDRVSNSCAL